MFLRTALLATLLPAFTSLFTVTARALAHPAATSTSKIEPSWLLTQTEYLRLTPTEQKAYVRDVQRVLASLPERGRAFAAVKPGVPPKRTVASEETEEPGSDQLRFTAEGADEGDGDDVDASAAKPSLAEAVGARAPSPPAAAPSANVKPTEFGQPTMLTAIPASARAEEVPEEIRSAAPQATGGRFYRCMYAGFVLKQDPCKGPHELPADVKLEGIAREQLACPRDEVLCNPLLFGLKASCDLMPFDSSKKDCLAKSGPICIHRSVSATSDCAAISNDQSLSAAAALIGANGAAWNDYLTSFYELCDDEKIAVNGFADVKDGAPREVPERTRTDIRQTCAHAKEQLKRVAEKYRSVETKRPAAPPAATETSKGQK